MLMMVIPGTYGWFGNNKKIEVQTQHIGIIYAEKDEKIEPTKGQDDQDRYLVRGMLEKHYVRTRLLLLLELIV